MYSVGCASLCSTSEVMLKQVKSMAVQIMSVPASSRFPSQNRKQANCANYFTYNFCGDGATMNKKVCTQGKLEKLGSAFINFITTN